MLGANTEAVVPSRDGVLRKAVLPRRGVAAHRGGPFHSPENTLAAFRNAVNLGAHQVEFDLRRTRDGEIVVIHDASVDRTTNGRGKVSEHCLRELRALDAGGGETIPTLGEALAVLPRDIWINLQIKRGEPIAAEVARRVVEEERLDQVFLACGNEAGRAAREVSGDVRICSLARQRTRLGYVDHAIRMGASVIQFHHLRGPMEPALAERAQGAGLTVNFFCAPNPSEEVLVSLFDVGVDFILIDDLSQGLAVAEKAGISPVRRSSQGGSKEQTAHPAG